MKNIKTILIFVMLLAGVGIFNFANVSSVESAGMQSSTQKLKDVAGAEVTGLNKDLNTLVARLVSGAFVLVGTIFFILVIFSGLTWMTAYGNEDRVEKARKTLIAAVIGLVITVSSYAITSFFVGRISGEEEKAVESGSLPKCNCVNELNYTCLGEYTSDPARALECGSVATCCVKKDQ